MPRLRGQSEITYKAESCMALVPVYAMREKNGRASERIQRCCRMGSRGHLHTGRKRRMGLRRQGAEGHPKMVNDRSITHEHGHYSYRFAGRLGDSQKICGNLENPQNESGTPAHAAQNRSPGKLLGAGAGSVWRLCRGCTMLRVKKKRR